MSLIMGLVPHLLGLSLLITYTLIGYTDATVMGIDLGSEYIKIAAVRPRTGIDIILNEQTRRKSNQYVGFRGEDQYIGEDALNLAPRFPNNMITMLNRLIGVPFDDVETREWFSKELLYTYNLIENERRKTIDIHIAKNPIATYDIETLLGIIFAYIKQITKDHNDGIEISDAVLVVPVFYTVRQRQALVDAARLGGINILGMIHTTTAIALQYGIQNRGFNQTVDLVVYDMGASRTEVGVYTITPPAKNAKKADSLGSITTQSIQYDRFLGGRTFDSCIAKKLAELVKEKTAVDISANLATEKGAKVAVVLMRAANKAREVLSANKYTPVTVESVKDDEDFTTTVTREEFESWCGHLFDKSVVLAQDALTALSNSHNTTGSLHSFEIHGGGVRMPKLQTDLAKVLRRSVNRTMNGDESAALGAAYYAARLYGSFVVRGFALKEVYHHNVTFALSPRNNNETASLTDAEPIHHALFSNAVLPRRKSISVNRTENFDISLFVGSAVDRVVHMKDVPSTLTAVGFDKSDKNVNNTHTVRVEVRLTESGVVNITQASLKYNEWVNVTKRVLIKNNTTTNATNSSSADAAANHTSTTSSNETPPPPPSTTTTDEEPSAAANGEDMKEEEEEEEKKHNSSDDDTDATSEQPSATATPTAEEGDEIHSSNTTNNTNTNNSTDPSVNVTHTPPPPPKKEYRTEHSIKQKNHQKSLSYEIEYSNPQPMNETEFISSSKKLKEMALREIEKRATAAVKNDLESLLIGIFTDYLDRFDGFITAEEIESIQSAAAVAREWLEDGDGASDATTKAQYTEQLAKVQKAMSGPSGKKQAHLKAIEDAKREAVKKALQEEKQRLAALKQKAAEEKAAAKEKAKEAEEAAKEAETKSEEHKEEEASTTSSTNTTSTKEEKEKVPAEPSTSSTTTDEVPPAAGDEL